MFIAVSEGVETVGDEMIRAAVLIALITVAVIIVVAVWSIRAPESAPAGKPMSMFIGLLVAIVTMLFFGGVLYQDIDKQVDHPPGSWQTIENSDDP